MKNYASCTTQTFFTKIEENTKLELNCMKQTIKLNIIQFYDIMIQN